VINFHADRIGFADALKFTEGETGFSARLVEKDYYCTLLLEYLSAHAPELVFKGGTCLAKVHVRFFRLSEDLDFTLPVACDSTRGQRRNAVKTFKNAYDALPSALSCFRIQEPLIGANNSTQYAGTLAYESLVTGQTETIKVDAGLREPLLMESAMAEAQTLLLDPATGKTGVPPVLVRCLSRTEALAEKVRAALTRREAAIRDFYDLDYAARVQYLRVDDKALLDLLSRKLAIPGNGSVNVSKARMAELRVQIQSQLQPVLRPEDWESFNLDRAFGIVADMAARVR
jgi:predicted nucleotidyltransferase component of viral defense system